MPLTSKRTYLTVVLALAATSGLVMVAVVMPWVDVRTSTLGGGVQADQLTGERLSPLVRAVGVVGLAAVAGTIASRGRGRIVVGCALALAGLAGTWAAIAATRDLAVLTGPEATTQSTGWPWLAAAGCLAICVLGVLIASAGRHWPGMASRYQRARQPAARSPWEAMDHGDDPTA